MLEQPHLYGLPPYHFCDNCSALGESKNAFWRGKVTWDKSKLLVESKLLSKSESFGMRPSHLAGGYGGWE